MGQRISSSRLPSLLSVRSQDKDLPELRPPGRRLCRRSRRRLSLGSDRDLTRRGGRFDTLGCFRSRARCECGRVRRRHCRYSVSRSQDRDMSHVGACPGGAHCGRCGFARNISDDSGLSNACAVSVASLRNDTQAEDVQNGNDSASANTCVKSSSIDRYMSALTDRMDKTQLSNECTCRNKNDGEGNKNSVKLCGSKSYSKRLDAASGSSQVDCFKKKKWVSRFCGSQSKSVQGKNVVKISGSTAAKSADSGLDADPDCVCTLYRKTDDTACRTQPDRCTTSAAPQNLSLGFARDRANWSRAPSSNTCVGCEASHGTQQSPAAPQQQQQSQSFNIANLPFNITVARVALARGDTLYGALQPGTGAQGSGAVYGTLQNGTGNIYSALVADDGNSILLSVGTQNTPLIDLRLSAEEYSPEDCEERARIRRAWEIAEGVEPPPGYRPVMSPTELRALIFHRQSRIHTQVDYIHCLVPDLKAINNCSFYWGKMDRYEAERLLEGKPEGTFLLRDSAQEEYLFSVSFRKYGRSLHARIEQFNHKFSFDSHDPGVYAADTVTGLIEHYKDPACVMFFEPMLTAPLSRTLAFPLQHLCRAVIASSTTYDGINELRLPQTLKTYLKEYHYRQRVRVKRFEGPPEGMRWEPEDAI